MRYSRITLKGWIGVLGFFNKAVKTRDDIVHAVTQAVIEEQCFKDTEYFSNHVGPDGGEEGSEDSVDSNLCNFPRTKADLDQRNSITRNKRESIHYMLKHQQTHVVGNRIMSPLGNKLPEDKDRWMDTTIMRKAQFTPGRHNTAGFASFRGLLDHLQMKQESSIHHRALLLWNCVHGEEGAMFWNKPCNLYRHEDEEVQTRIDQSKALNAPEDESGYILRHFECMVLGQEERWQQRLKYREDIDWDFVERGMQSPLPPPLPWRCFPWRSKLQTDSRNPSHCKYGDGGAPQR